MLNKINPLKKIFQIENKKIKINNLNNSKLKRTINSLKYINKVLKKWVFTLSFLKEIIKINKEKKFQ
jgi:hypothetical protein